jgi:hypothetical protein
LLFALSLSRYIIVIICVVPLPLRTCDREHFAFEHTQFNLETNELATDESRYDLNEQSLILEEDEFVLFSEHCGDLLMGHCLLAFG